MSAWFTSNLGDALLAEQALAQLKALFLTEFQKANCPSDMALFMRHESEGRLHCEVIVYFSPAAVTFANAAGANSCNKPSTVGLSLLAGAEDAWPVLFP